MDDGITTTLEKMTEKSLILACFKSVHVKETSLYAEKYKTI
jgi:hypothetical protein